MVCTVVFVLRASLSAAHPSGPTRLSEGEPSEESTTWTQGSGHSPVRLMVCTVVFVFSSSPTSAAPAGPRPFPAWSCRECDQTETLRQHKQQSAYRRSSTQWR